MVEMVLVPDPDPWSPGPHYYALIYDGPASDSRASFMLGSDDLRELAARLRAVDAGKLAGSVVITLEEVDDGADDSDVHPQIRSERRRSLTLATRLSHIYGLTISNGSLTSCNPTGPGQARSRQLST
jgi:hypothetical protein